VFFYQPLAAILRLVFPCFLQGLELSRVFSFSLGRKHFWVHALASCALTCSHWLWGCPAAYLFSHFEFAGRKFLRLVALLPFILPTVVTAVCFNSRLVRAVA
jgi:thiamine transport system permease protein